MNLQENIQRIQEMMGVIKEQEEFDFYKTIYNPDDKSIVGAYMMVGETEKMIEIMNIKESRKDETIYMDNSVPYFISVYRAMLPKSQVEIIKPVEGMENFFYFKIPYWLYKKLSNELEIRRVKGKKRVTINYKQSRDTEFLKKINDPEVEKYMTITNPDKTGIMILKNTASGYKPE